jgi:uncharacterized membrane protein
MSSTDNPYRPPSATVADIPSGNAGAVFGVPAARVGASRGLSWISEGWTLFKAAPVMWIVALLILFGVQMVLGLIPILGSLVSIVIGPFFMAGMLAFAHGIAQGEDADLGKLFIGLQQKTGALIAVALVYFLIILGLIVVFGIGVFVMLGGAAALSAASPEAMVSSLLAGGGVMGFVLLLLVFFAVAMLVAAAYWYAPGLVLYTDLGAVDAMKESFRACLANWVAFLVYGFVGLLVILGGMLALVIGFFLVSLPLLMASYYISFRDLFGREA